jgi:hypothetical protein
MTMSRAEASTGSLCGSVAVAEAGSSVAAALDLMDALASDCVLAADEGVVVGAASRSDLSAAIPTESLMGALPRGGAALVWLRV